MTVLQDLLQQIRDLEQRVSEEVGREAERFGYTIRQGRVYFEEELARRHKTAAKRITTYLAESSLPTLATAPVIYSLIIPLVLIDLFAWLYQTVCFPVYRIPKVRRSDYLVFDRHRLRYLNAIERAHCWYCSYANGLIAYAQEIAARTEQYWCPLKHSRGLKATHSRYYLFLSYGDAQAYTAELEKLRRQFQDLE